MFQKIRREACPEIQARSHFGSSSISLTPVHSLYIFLGEPVPSNKLSILKIIPALLLAITFRNAFLSLHQTTAALVSRPSASNA